MLEVKILPALRIAAPQIAQMRAADLASVRLDGMPRLERGIQLCHSDATRGLMGRSILLRKSPVGALQTRLQLLCATPWCRRRLYRADQDMFVGGHFLLVRPDHRDAHRVAEAARGVQARAAARRVEIRAQDEFGLAAGHGEIHLGQDPRIEQRAVVFAMRIVDRIALAQRIEVVALSGMHLARERSVSSTRHSSRDPERALLEARELGVQEGDVERRVVNDEFGVADEIQELGMNLRKRRFLRELFARQAMHLQGALVDVAIRIQVAVKGAPGQAAIEELDAANFDDAMAVVRLRGRWSRYRERLAASGLYPPRQQAIDGAIRELIDVLIAFMSGMSLDPMPLDILPRRGRIELLP